MLLKIIIYCLFINLIKCQEFKQFIFPNSAATTTTTLNNEDDDIKIDTNERSILTPSYSKPLPIDSDENNEPINDSGNVPFPLNSRISFPLSNFEQIPVNPEYNNNNNNYETNYQQETEYIQQPYYPSIEQPNYPEKFQTPLPIIPTSSGVKQPYEINYCNPEEFPDNVLSQYGLEKINYFIYNKTCSGEFFQCSIGQTYLFECLTQDQAFDPSIVNCNYRYDNRICPEYDHIMHCTIKETCKGNEFACCAHPQMCIDLSRRCDGHNDCVDGQDETDCPSCSRDEFACVKSGRCIPANMRCNGNADDCEDGSNLDEIGCSKNSTCWGKFVCDSPQTLATLGHSECIDYELHCNGEKNCPGGEDELNCRQASAKYLLCENQKQSVLKEQWCDGQEHCADGSDEKYCY